MPSYRLSTAFRAEGVHAVLAGGLVTLASLRRGDDSCRDESGLPRAVIEVGPPNRSRTLEAGEQQPPRDKRTVRPEPQQGDLYRRFIRCTVSRVCGTPPIVCPQYAGGRPFPEYAIRRE
ncbi:hypothetical protein [Actinopolymorpha pittospori]|uniref:Uncharacterized protein n=1 Tax=Actinopolymorpha pittospori TaxID=648752 RepID=A0A927N4T5_9ACTN|nr:hypothetical protein [Actinopolymorpha pittospori]MBE1610988.1 hypothetical protein [Actinopolymorpha pittospori]